MRKELAGNPYSSMVLAKEAAEAVRPVPIFEANNYGYDILWVRFLMSMRSVQRGLNYRISSCNFIADWTIVTWGRHVLLALLASWLQLTFRSVHINLDRTSFFQFGKNSVIPGSYQHSWFSKWPFLHYNEAEDTVICHSCMKMFKGVSHPKIVFFLKHL